MPDEFVDVRAAAKLAGVSVPTFYRAVASGRMPSAYYPSPGTARWLVSEIRAAILATKDQQGRHRSGRRLAA
jgi:predicted DNA-binding transcriptional regulator AlpA